MKLLPSLWIESIQRGILGDRVNTIWEDKLDLYLICHPTDNIIAPQLAVIIWDLVLRTVLCLVEFNTRVNAVALFQTSTNRRLLPHITVETFVSCRSCFLAISQVNMEQARGNLEIIDTLLKGSLGLLGRPGGFAWIKRAKASPGPSKITTYNPYSLC